MFCRNMHLHIWDSANSTRREQQRRADPEIVTGCLTPIAATNVGAVVIDHRRIMRIVPGEAAALPDQPRTAAGDLHMHPVLQLWQLF